MKNYFPSPLKQISVSLILALGSTGVWAQTLANYPDKPVKVIIPFPPGGTLDKIGRMLALKVGEQLGQNFVVENRPGGNGIIGADVVAKSNPDGYTLLFNASTFVTAPMTMKSVPYKVQTDFTPIGLIASAPLSIAISNKLGVTDIKGLAAAAKANPGKLNFAVGSIGSAGHLCTVKLEQATGSQIAIVPYKGTGPAMTDWDQCNSIEVVNLKLLVSLRPSDCPICPMSLQFPKQFQSFSVQVGMAYGGQPNCLQTWFKNSILL